MGFAEDDARRLGLRTGFGRAAADYQRTRPVCPPRLFDDLIDLAGLEAGERVIEVGCGTGQATVPLAERGLAVTAVELGPGLAAIARRRLASFPNAEVVTCSFENWQPRSGPFDGGGRQLSALDRREASLLQALRAAEIRGCHGRGRVPVGTACGR
jgi:SAM-dependent methyltransferase